MGILSYLIVYCGCMLGLHRDNGKQNEHYWDYRGYFRKPQRGHEIDNPAYLPVR